MRRTRGRGCELHRIPKDLGFVPMGPSPACKVQQFCMELVGCPSSGIREMRCEEPKVFLSLNC